MNRSALLLLSLTLALFADEQRRLRTSEQFPIELTALLLPQEVKLAGTGITVSELNRDSTSFQLNPHLDKLPLGVGELRYEGGFAFAPEADIAGQEFGYTIQGEMSSTTLLLYFDNSSYNNQLHVSTTPDTVANSSQESTQLTVGASTRLQKFHRNAFFWGGSITQTFLSKGEITDSPTNGIMIYREYSPWDPNFTFAVAGGIDYTAVWFQREKYQAFATLEYDVSLFRPDPIVREDLVEFANGDGYDILSFQRTATTTHNVGFRAALAGPSRENRTVHFSRKKRHYKPAPFAIDFIDITAVQQFKRATPYSINYRFNDGVIDTTSGKYQERNFTLHLQMQTELLLFKHLYVWSFLETGFTREPKKTTGFFTAAPFGTGVRGTVGKALQLDVSGIFNEGSFSVAGRVSYLFD